MSAPETCGGYCCERFHFRHNQTLEELKEEAKQFPEGHERRFVADMLIFIEKSPKDLDGDGTIPVNWFTCKHFDTTTRLCKVYEQRPKMCRDFNMWWNPCGMSKCKLPKPTPPPRLRELSQGSHQRARAMTIKIEALTYRSVPKGYECGRCHATGVKLWREYQTFMSHQSLLCKTCVPLEHPEAAKRHEEFVRKYGEIDTDQLCGMVPAVPTEDGSTFWGYSSVPQTGVNWWKNLPETPV